MATTDFSAITELPGAPATRPQLERIVQRYQFAGARVAGRRVLEVACGAGLGLGYLGRTASRVVGGDYTRSLLDAAREHYGSRIPLQQLDAQRLPFAAGAFDAIVIFEAIYYLPDPDAFLAEARRVLTPGGLLLVSSVNPEWAGHSPSSFSTRYPSLSELATAARRAGFEVAESFGGFPVTEGGAHARAIDAARAFAAKHHLIPNTLAARALLKCLVYGRSTGMPAEISEQTAAAPPLEPIPSDSINSRHQVVYLVAHTY